jgi:SWI/SNF-related matrix-associated actin-dependent regulator 1 of chromatin subfamily A
LILDYVSSTRSFVVRVPRSSGTDVQLLMQEHGLDFSVPASTPGEAVLFTKEPYAAAAFGEYATPQAREQLHGILTEIDASWKLEGKGHYKVPADQELWGFQKADLEYALRRNNTLIGDQPGLGKTPTAITFANEIGAKRVLVLCPASIRLQWVKRIREWTTLRWPYHIHAILNSRHGVHPHAEWTVVSYDLARTEAIGKGLARGLYDLLILDEAHYLKSVDAGRTRAVFGGGDVRHFEPLASRCGAILALTGTPLPNRPREAYTLARGLHFDAIDWLSEDAFKRRFNPSIRNERIDPKTGMMRYYTDERTGRHAELQSRLRSTFMVRHLKREVMTQLHMPIYDIIQLEETGAVKQALEAESLLDIDPENLEGADAETLGHISVIRKQMGIALAPQVADYVEMLLDGGEEKLVLFAWHIEVLDMLQARLHKYGLVRIDGSTGAVKKQKLVDKFIAEPGVQICLGNIQSMGTGTDGLQKVSNHALIAEPSWTPSDNEQAFDRLDRGGQTRQVQGDIFVAPRSFAERVLASSLRKHQTTHKALDRRIA